MDYTFRADSMQPSKLECVKPSPPHTTRGCENRVISPGQLPPVTAPYIYTPHNTTDRKRRLNPEKGAASHGKQSHFQIHFLGHEPSRSLQFNPFIDSAAF